MKKTAINVILAVCFVFFLINLNAIVGAFQPSAKECKFPEITSRAKCYIERIVCDSGEKVAIRGWALAETNQSNEQKTIEIILQGKDKCYSYLLPEIEDRSGVTVTMQNEGYMVAGINHGVSTVFSTVNVDSGTYNIWMQSNENETSKGADYSGYQLIKRGREVSVNQSSSYILGKTAVSAVKEIPKSNAKVLGSVDSVKILEDGIVDIQGWAFCEIEKSNVAKKISVLFCSDEKQFLAKTVLMTRWDLVKAYGPSSKIRGPMHGYVTEADLSSLPDGEYQIMLYCEEGEGVSGIYESGKWIEKTGNTVSYISEQKNSVPIEAPVVEQPVKNRVSPVKYHELVNPANKVAYNVEVLTVEGPDVSIEGWAFCETEADNSGKAITLLLKGKEEAYAVETELKARKDVLDCFASERKIQGENHGFRTEFEMSSLPDGTYELLILCQETPETGNVTQTAISIEKSGNDINILR